MADNREEPDTMELIDGHSVRHLRRTLSRKGCLAVWNQFVGDVQDVVQGSPR
jgi:hypothetical protein